jgi:hypothetical protein
MGKKVKEISGDFNADSIIEESRNILSTLPTIDEEPKLSDEPNTDDGQPPEQESVREPKHLPESEAVQQKREPTVNNNVNERPDESKTDTTEIVQETECLPESESVQQMEPAPMPVTAPPPKRQEHREPSGRKRGLPSYRDVFVTRNEIKHRQCVYISHEVHSLISSLVRMLVDDGGEITVGGYIDKVLYEHLQAYKDEINELYRNSRPELLK